MVPLEKPCTKCLISLPLESFILRKAGKYGRDSICKKCRSAMTMARYWKRRDHFKAKRLEYRNLHLEESRAKDREWYRNNPEKAAKKNAIRRYRIKGITEKDYLDRYSAQGGKCAICSRHFEKLVIDHSHETGVVRGLLCSNCNSAVGLFSESPERMESAIRYLSENGSISDFAERRLTSDLR